MPEVGIVDLEEQDGEEDNDEGDLLKHTVHARGHLSMLFLILYKRHAFLFF